MKSRKNLNDIPKWVDERYELVKGARVFGVDISEEMTKKELMAIIGYLIGKNQNDADQHQKEMDLIFDLQFPKVMKRLVRNGGLPKTFYYTLIDGVDLHDEIKIGDFLYEIVAINHVDGMMTVERITDEYLKGE